MKRFTIFLNLILSAMILSLIINGSIFLVMALVRQITRADDFFDPTKFLIGFAGIVVGVVLSTLMKMKKEGLKLEDYSFSSKHQASLNQDQLEKIKSTLKRLGFNEVAQSNDKTTFIRKRSTKVSGLSDVVTISRKADVYNFELKMDHPIILWADFNLSRYHVEQMIFPK